MTDHEADIATLHQEATQLRARIKRLEAEHERLVAALSEFRGRYRLYCGWPHLEWAGETDKRLLAMADETLDALQESSR